MNMLFAYILKVGYIIIIIKNSIGFYDGNGWTKETLGMF